jgi:hypothetical protein
MEHSVRSFSIMARRDGAWYHRARHFFVRVAETFVTLVLFPFSVDGELPTESLHCVSFNPPLFILLLTIRAYETILHQDDIPGEPSSEGSFCGSPRGVPFTICLCLCYCTASAYCILSCDISGLGLSTADLRDLRI